jgi:hypothetical protein
VDADTLRMLIALSDEREREIEPVNIRPQAG